MKYTFFETKSGKKIKTAQFDGYAIAERLLEALMFQVTIQDDGSLKVWIKPEDEGYFQQFNTTKFLNLAKEYAEENDIFSEPITNEDCWFEVCDENSESVKANGILVKIDAVKVPKTFTPGIPELVRELKSLQDIIQKSGATVYGVGEGGTTMTLGVNGNGEFEIDIDVAELEPKVLGKFKPKATKFHDFIATVGNVNVLSKEATIDGKYFDSLNLEGVKFKMILRDYYTFDLEEIGTENCDEKDIQRYALMLEDSSVGGFRNRSVVVDYKFIATHIVKEKEIQMESFLVCDQRKPYDDLVNFLEEDEKELPEIDEEKLRFLFEDDEVIVEPPTPVIKEELSNLTMSQQLIFDEFLEAKKEKRNQHLKKIETISNEKKVATNNLKLAENKISECEEEINLLNSRIDSLEINETFNGYFYYIPPVISEKCILPSDVKELIANKLANVRNINPVAFLKLFDKNIFSVRIGLETEGNIIELNDFKNVMPIINSYTNWEGHFYIENNMLFFEGEIDWAKLSNKLIKNGFKHEHSFEDYCVELEKQQTCAENCSCHNHSENEEDSVEGELENFKECNGYEMGDEFLFAIQYNPDGVTDDICDENQVTIAITPKTYWENDKCCYDQHLSEILNHKFPILNETRCLDEVVEAGFVLLKDTENTMNLNEAIEYLCKTGLKFSIAYQDYLSKKDTQLIKYLISIINPSIII